MDSKPLNALAAEVAGLKVMQWDSFCLIDKGQESKSLGQSVPNYHTDDGTALELLKTLKKLDNKFHWKIGQTLQGDHWCIILRDYQEIGYAENDSLAQSICLALIAASEKGERT